MKRFRVVPLRKENKGLALQAEKILDLFNKGLISKVEMKRRMQLAKAAKQLEKENLAKVIQHPSKDAFLITPYSGKHFEIDALEFEDKNLCIECLVERARLTSKKKMKVFCLEDKQKYAISICPVCYKGDPIVKVRLIKKPPNKLDLDLFKKEWFRYTEYARRIKFLNGKEILKITPEYIESMAAISEDLSPIDIAQHLHPELFNPELTADDQASSYLDLSPKSLQDALNAYDPWTGKVQIAPSELMTGNPYAYGKLKGSHYAGTIMDDLVNEEIKKEADGEKRFFKTWEEIKKRIGDKK